MIFHGGFIDDFTGGFIASQDTTARSKLGESSQNYAILKKGGRRRQLERNVPAGDRAGGHEPKRGSDPSVS
jgi:hypothetical protein